MKRNEEVENHDEKVLGPNGLPGPKKSPLAVKGEAILRGQASTPGELLQLADDLKDEEKRFGLARKLLAHARQMPAEDSKQQRKLRQRHALCTYKDSDLPADSRYDQALEILRDGEDLATTEDQQTLGLAGAIFKRKWRLDGQQENLERSLSYYLRGSTLSIEKDQGYTSVNAAYALDLLASIEAQKSATSFAMQRREQARALRDELITNLPRMLDDPGNAWIRENWWFYATLAEAHFGLEQYDIALRWLTHKEKARTRKGKSVPEWELQSTATQLADLARFQNDGMPPEEFKTTKAFKVLEAFAGDSTTAALTAYVGKVGLALSGGGFRASLFHIGVLAKLAELDVLRHVEVLSCVSGGSILGAHCYLELRNLLQQKDESELEQDDYIQLIKRLQRDFLEAIQRNIRNNLFAEFSTNLRMIFLPDYSRTMRAGELYEQLIYSKIQDDAPDDSSVRAGWRSRKRWLTGLYIIPKGESRGFRPRNDNWRRKHKVPELILNATTLNTGHSWQFTASWMGEPPNSIDTDLDGNYRLRRMYYWEAPAKHRKIRLGHAVAASAAVPGFFEPLSLPNLYPETIIQLVDGGVYDNQGIVGLLTQDCNVILVSDASGPIDTSNQPGRGVLAVPMRSNSIVMSRVRSRQFDEIEALTRSRRVRGRMFIHLKQGLKIDPVDWIDSKDLNEASQSRYGLRVLTNYGIRKDIQEKLAEIRTDLDSFSDAEAYALMTSGYLMTEYSFKYDPTLKSISKVRGKDEEWDFLRIEPVMKSVEEPKLLLRLLGAGRSRAFKVWKFWLPLMILKWTLTIGLFGLAMWGSITYWESSIQLPAVRVQHVAVTMVLALVLLIFGKWVMRRGGGDTLLQVAIGIGLALAGPLLIRPYLYIFDRLYLKLGKVERIAGSRNS